MRKFLIVILLLFVSTMNVAATESNGVEEVKSGVAAAFSKDNDGDGINDWDDLCKNTSITPTHTDSNMDGCDDSTIMLLKSTAYGTKDVSKENINDTGNNNNDYDGDSINDVDDACIYFAPAIDTNTNGCEDDDIRTLYVDSIVEEDSFTITGIAFVDGQEFSEPDMYTTEVEFHNLATGEYIPGKVATNYCDSSINESITGAIQDISCSAFTVTFYEEDFTPNCDGDSECLESQKNKDDMYSIDVTLTDNEGQKYTETLYSASDFNGNNSGVVRISAEEYRVHLTIK